MRALSLAIRDQVVIEPTQLQELFAALHRRGYKVVGPTVRDGAIVYDELDSTADLPKGGMDEQDGGTYRLRKRPDQALFGYAVGPHSWKKYLLPPTLRLWQVERQGSSVQIVPERETPPKLAFIGVRSCELHAIAVQDKVFMQGSYVDPTYKGRREAAFVVAVSCGQAGGTSFCVSMKTGPKATFGFDLALMEVLNVEQHSFMIEVGTTSGAELLQDIPHRPAAAEARQAAENIVAQTITQMGRALDTTDIKPLLYRNYEHPRWDEVAPRCLTCANCTMVCPTCFCTTTEEVTDLTDEHAERWRKWDSCFNVDFSYIHGGSVRSSPKARYRQWLTHKLATWIDQFGTSGCVGCGRCITWCPVAIDITEEVRAIRDSDGATTPIAEGTHHADPNG